MFLASNSLNSFIIQLNYCIIQLSEISVNGKKYDIIKKDFLYTGVKSMNDDSLELIEQQVTDFIRRVVLTEKSHDALDRSAYILLRHLSTYGPSGVKQLAKDLHLDISTVSRQARVLVQRMYIEKVPHPEDKRAYFYKTTQLGLKELAENKIRRYNRLADILDDWNEEEKAVFGEMLQKYNQSVNEKINLK